jgi:hypothetical protein
MSEGAVWDKLTRFEQRALIELFGGGSFRANSPAVANELRARGATLNLSLSSSPWARRTPKLILRAHLPD